MKMISVFLVGGPLDTVMIYAQKRANTIRVHSSEKIEVFLKREIKSVITKKLSSFINAKKYD